VTKEYKRVLFRFVPYVVIGLFLVILPSFVGLALVSLTTKILIFGLLVMSLDLLVGYTGIGAYTTGILINEFEITNFWLTAPASVLMAVIAACIFGLIALRVSQVYFLLITLAMGQLVYGIVNTSAGTLGAMTGGSDGLGSIPYPEFGLSFTPVGFYYFSFIVFVICAFLMRRIIASPLGYGLQGVREREIRLQALGYNTWLYKYIAFVIGGLFAGVAGVLYVHFNGFISPDALGVEATGMLWLMLIIGGSGTIWGRHYRQCGDFVRAIFCQRSHPGEMALDPGGLFCHCRAVFSRRYLPCSKSFMAQGRE